MTDPRSSSVEIPPPPPRQPVRWRRAWRELRALLAALSDRAALARLPEETLGRAYLAYLERNDQRGEAHLPLPERDRGSASARSSRTTCSTC